MKTEQLERELARVGGRFERMHRLRAMARVWLALALAAGAVLAAVEGVRAEFWANLLLAAVGLFAWAMNIVYARKRTQDRLWLAREIERRFPELDARLMAAVQEEPV